AESIEAARSSPHLEIFRKKGVEVLLLTDRIDEWMLSFLTEFEGKPLTSVAKGDLSLEALDDEQDKQERRKAQDEFKDLVARIKQALGERVADVRITLRLTESPACVVVDKDAMSAHLQRMLKASGHNAPPTKPILELNPHHPLVQRLQTDTVNLSEWASLLLEQAILAEGGQLDDPASFVKRVNTLLLGAVVKTPS
ncbi:MAG TPA: molecular chaperone HtpG, partial [Burkholderiaceae bacterium]|nr:molecular chaperone HtpG [Burkholderiaceae bacterium]